MAWEIARTGTGYVSDNGWQVRLLDDGGFAILAPASGCVAWRPDRECAMKEAERLSAEGFWN